MEKSIYKYVLQYTSRDQIYLLILTLVNLPFIYISLEIPKIIVNEAIGGQGAPYSMFGVDLSQVAYLLARQREDPSAVARALVLQCVISEDSASELLLQFNTQCVPAEKAWERAACIT